MKIFRYFTLLLLTVCTFQVGSFAQFTVEEKIDSTNANDVQEQKMELLVLDFKSKKPIEADVMIKGLNPRKTVVYKDVSDSTLILKKYRIYTVSVIKKGYMYFAHRFWPDEAETHVERIELKPLGLGIKSSIEDITFWEMKLRFTQICTCPRRIDRLPESKSDHQHLCDRSCQWTSE
ncbi:MAG: hypothetical protein IPP69_00225 [Flavobacteriales bacterium]|nr:hypothetical protein [Flavobacteriales bacterium]